MTGFVKESLSADWFGGCEGLDGSHGWGEKDVAVVCGRIRKATRRRGRAMESKIKNKDTATLPLNERRHW